MGKVYLTGNPTAKSVLESVSSSNGSPVCYDHFAFRTFGVDGHGIDSIASFFLDFGYTQRDELRIFISELLVDELNSQSQLEAEENKFIKSKKESFANSKEEEASKDKLRKQHLVLDQQQRNIQELKHSLRTTRAGMEFMQMKYYEEFSDLGKLK
ncbi:uncharacterized protein A4U43_C01F25440 [Asparagus officinalis]|uniref:Uncharacterized protein n=1 Tax=Asparagus officinalis TaxID=4686 RepID=A0A5P1FSN7_ASPOF|nr:uncharacterized protein A4U43_C01F25440 [Asparagus officinalis]